MASFFVAVTDVFAEGNAISLPKTGQTKCYDTAGDEISCAGTGQDGDIQAGSGWPEVRFTDDGDGTQIDNLTGLMWAKNADTPDVDSCIGGAKTWQGALDYVKFLNEHEYLGYSDWRLPNINELDSLANLQESDLVGWLDGSGFINVQSEYWSSTSRAMPGTDSAWYSFLDSSFYNSGKLNTYYAWPVRAGQFGLADANYPANVAKTGQKESFYPGDDGDIQAGAEWPAERFSDSGSDTVTDNLTGLIWTKDASTPAVGECNAASMTWQGALDYIQCLNSNSYLGHSDWRLPNRKELDSLVDFSQYGPALPIGNPFINFRPYEGYHYISSSSYVEDKRFFYYKNYDEGSEGAAWKDNRFGMKFLVWPVRGEASQSSSGYSSVMFLPGIEGSRLYAMDDPDCKLINCENQLWEPNRNEDVQKLYLNGTGKSLNGDIYTRNVIDEVNILPVGQGNIYKSFLADLECWKTSGDISDYAVIPYDWRLSFEDILLGGQKEGENIFYSRSSSSSYIVSELLRLANSSSSKKVTIIAHSNGGLLAKALIERLGEVEAKRLIDKIVFVGVPQKGTPKAIGALLHGFGQGLPTDWMPLILSPGTARTMANNMSGAYPLLPSDSYFQNGEDWISTPPISFDDGPATKIFTDKYGDKINIPSELERFLLDTDGKVSADSDDLYTPSRINPSLLSYGENIHQSLDSNWKLPDDISLYEIAGFGEDTPATLRYWTGLRCDKHLGALCLKYSSQLLYTPDMVVDGDGTVVVPSALAISQDVPNVEKYWLDLDSYNNTLPNSLSHFDRKHADIFEVSELRNFIKNIVLINSSDTLPDYFYVSEPPTKSQKRLRYYLHSPLSLSARDGDGNEISASASTIPGARYERFGEVQYISLPADSELTLILDGQEEGSFTLEVQEAEGGTITASTIFSGILTSSDTMVTMYFSDGTIENASPLEVDYDGDGTTDISLEPKIGEIIVPEQDTTSPVTESSVEGTSGDDGWYMSDVTMTLTAKDEENDSGVEKTEYSLDDGKSWNLYTIPFQIDQEGIATILYASTDKAGNKEESKTLTVKIDKTPPEARIVFNPVTQKLNISGTDNLSQSVSVVLMEKTDMKILDKGVKKFKSWFSRWFGKNKKDLPDMLAILTDEAGHMTDITFEKKKDWKGYVFVKVKSIGYDESESIVSPNTVAQYKWQIDRKNQYRILASYLKADKTTIESRYTSRKNETWIMERPNELLDDERDDNFENRPTLEKFPGMVVPWLVTDKGKINIKY